MKLLKLILLSLVICSCNSETIAQSNLESYSFKKGEVMDILILTNKPEADSLFKIYRQTAFPVALNLSYKPIPGFNIKESTQGNLEAEAFYFGKWDNIVKREKYLDDIVDAVPDFHEQRRNIWSIFNLTYYEMPEDTNFLINKDKFNVVSAYWQKDANSMSVFKAKWFKSVQDFSGKNILALTNGTSPYGYYYQPDLMVITEWENRAAYEAFLKESLQINHGGLKQVNEFILN
jgi:hypothetical protein